MEMELETAFELTELHRRLANLVSLGRIAQADYAGAIPLCKVQIGELTTGWLPMLSLRAGPDSSWWPLEVGEQVVVFAPSGDLAQGVVQGAIHQGQFPANGDRPDVHRLSYDDGAVIEYNRKTHTLKAVLPGGATTELISDGGVVIVGDVTVNGNINATGDVSDSVRSMGEDRAIYNAHTHHGDSGGSTGSPVQRQ